MEENKEITKEDVEQVLEKSGLKVNELIKAKDKYQMLLDEARRFLEAKRQENPSYTIDEIGEMYNREFEEKQIQNQEEKEDITK